MGIEDDCLRLAEKAVFLHREGEARCTARMRLELWSFIHTDSC